MPLTNAQVAQSSVTDDVTTAVGWVKLTDASTEVSVYLQDATAAVDLTISDTDPNDDAEPAYLTLEGRDRVATFHNLTGSVWARSRRNGTQIVNLGVFTDTTIVIG